MEQLELLGLPSKQKHRVNSSQDTQKKVVLTELSAIFTKSSLETGKEHLNYITNILHYACSKIKMSLNPEKALDHAISLFSPDNREKALSVSRQAVEDNLPKDTKQNLDQKLQKNYVSCMGELDSIHAQSKEVILAIDTTPEETRSKYLNNQYSYCNIGQKNTWKRGFTYSSVYDCTHQLFLTNLHQNYHKSKHEYGSLQAFIKQLQFACRTVEKANSRVKYIDADRAYYDAELYAAAYFGVLSAECEEKYDIKVVAPKKFTQGKVEKKIAFLEDPNSEIVSLDYIRLSKYTHPTLIDRCKAAGLEKKDTMFLIPIVKVAVVDEYSAEKNRTFPNLQKNWSKTKTNIMSSTKRLKALNDAYVKEQKRVGIKKPRRVTRIINRKRKHRGHPSLLKLYKRICSTLEYIKRLKREQTEMLNALMFFSISLTEKEVASFDPKKYIDIASVYRERWGIENGFKEDKSKFVRSCRSRKSTQRQWNLSLGMMLYNRWHVDRMRKMLQIERQTVWNRVPWDPNLPYIRRKLERKHGKVLRAESFLLQLLEEGIKARLEKILS